MKKVLTIASLLLAQAALSSPQLAKLSRSTPVLKAPFSGGKLEVICESAYKGTKIKILDKKGFFDVKIEVLAGDCKNKTGWISSESVEAL